MMTMLPRMKTTNMPRGAMLAALTGVPKSVTDGGPPSAVQARSARPGSVSVAASEISPPPMT